MWKKLERRRTVDCQHVEAALIAYLRDGLSPTRRQVIEDHLAACEACARSLQQAQTLEAELRLQAARHIPTLSPQASARIRERVYKRMRRGLIMQRTVKLVGVAVAVVAIALLAVGVAALWQGREPEVAGVPQTTPSAGDTWTRPVDGAVMVYVPAGEFLMGSSDEDPDAEDDEKPQHTVYLDAFWIDKYEVTNAQYRKCVEAGACQAPWPCERGEAQSYDDPAKGNHPVVCVNWNKAQDYAAWVGGRLPTEAEWEKAARGTDGRLYPWGNSPPDCGKAHLYGCSEGPAAGTLPVGSHPDGASPYGAMGMGGNVMEWVADRWDEGYYAGSSARNPQGPESGNVRVVRGGGYGHSEDYLRCASRTWGYPDFEAGHSENGFRVVVAPGPSGP